MFTRRSPLTALILMVLVALAAAGCGGSDDESKSGSKGDSTKAATKTEDEPKAEAEDEDEDEQQQEEEQAEAEAVVSAGIDYEDAVIPAVGQFKSLLQRYDTTGTKLLDGSIDVARATSAFTKQAVEARSVAGEVRAISVDDDHLMTGNERLAVAFDEYAKAMTVLATLRDTMTEAEVDSTFTKAGVNVQAMSTALDEWSDYLLEDPEGRPFTRTAAALEDVSAFIDKL